MKDHFEDFKKLCRVVNENNEIVVWSSTNMGAFESQKAIMNKILSVVRKKASGRSTWYFPSLFDSQRIFIVYFSGVKEEITLELTKRISKELRKKRKKRVRQYYASRIPGSPQYKYEPLPPYKISNIPKGFLNIGSSHPELFI